MQVSARGGGTGTFSDHSYGFRPGRSGSAGGGTSAAVCRRWPRAGAFDLDLEKFFDRVSHDKLMGQIAKRVADKRLLKLIRAFLKARGDGERVGQTRAWKGLRKGVHFSATCSVTSCLDELDRGVGAPGPPLRFDMRMTVTSTWEAKRAGQTGDGERHAIHHAKAQTDGE